MYKYSKYVPLAMAIVCSIGMANVSNADPKSSAQGDASAAAPAKTPDSNATATVPAQPPQAAVDHYNNAVQLHQTGALDQAIVEYKLGIAGYERMWEAWCNLAVIYMTQQNYPAALDAIVHADTIKPNDGLLLDYYGQILFALGKDEDALTKFRRSIIAEPKWKDSYLKMANVLKFDGHQDQATELLNKMPKDAQ